METVIIVVGTVTCVVGGLAALALGIKRIVSEHKSRAENIMDIASGAIIITAALYFIGRIFAG